MPIKVRYMVALIVGESVTFDSFSLASIGVA
jgi:hypothetical protein